MMIRIEPLGHHLPFDIPTDGWMHAPPVAGLSELTGARHIIYAAKMSTGMLVFAMLGPATLMVTIADDNESWEVPEPWATDVMMAARKSIRATETKAMDTQDRGAL